MKTTKTIKYKLHKGDTVKVLSGNSKNQTGKILFIDIKRGRAIVEGLNKVSKHIKPKTSKAQPDGGIITKEASINMSNLMLVDPSSGEATRVGRKLNDKNKLQRFSKTTGEFIS